MKTLGDENAVLIKQVEDGTRIRQENEKLKREMAEFKELYASRVRGRGRGLPCFILDGHISCDSVQLICFLLNNSLSS